MPVEGSGQVPGRDPDLVDQPERLALLGGDDIALPVPEADVVVPREEALAHIRDEQRKLVGSDQQEVEEVRRLGAAGCGHTLVRRGAVVGDRCMGDAGRLEGSLEPPRRHAQTQIGTQVADEVHPEGPGCVDPHRRWWWDRGFGQCDERGLALAQAMAPQPPQERWPVAPARMGKGGREIVSPPHQLVDVLVEAAEGTTGGRQRFEEPVHLARNVRVDWMLSRLRRAEQPAVVGSQFRCGGHTGEDAVGFRLRFPARLQPERCLPLAHLTQPG